MGDLEGSREAVAEQLAGLQLAYGSVPVHQTTISVSGPRFETVADQYAGSPVDAFVAVENGNEEVLHVDTDAGLALPGTAADADTRLERAAREAVEAATGVVCELAELKRVRIAGVRNDDDPDGETLYRLVAVFTARYLDGETDSDAEWAARPQSTRPVRV